MPRQVIQNMKGGFSLEDPQKLKINQFQQLKNWFYNSEGKIQTRRGIERYFATIPDTVTTIQLCDATTNFSLGGDGANLAAGTAIRGTFSVQFDVDVSVDPGNSTTLSNSSISADISSTKDYLGFWLFVPTGFNTNLSAVKFRLGTDSSNYYEWTLGTLTENANNFIKLNFADATTTGTINDASITYIRLEITYAAGYTDKTALKLDWIQAYSSTYTKPPQGYFSFRREDTFARVTIVTAGGNSFLWNKTAEAWERIDSGLTQFETKTGITDHRTRWSHFSYLNIVYMCDGVNDYRSWNGTKITTYPAQPKCRYFINYKERIVSGGEDANPYTVYATAAAAADAATLNTNEADIGWEEEGSINGLLWNNDTYFIILKSAKKYYCTIDSLNVFDFNPITDSQGGFSNRAFTEVGNGIMNLTNNGIDVLALKKSQIGGAALESKPIGAGLYKWFKLITTKQKNANCGHYYKDLYNYYFSFDTADDNKPDRTIVYSAQQGIGSWTQYTYPAAYQYGNFTDSDGNENHLLCSASSGLIYKIETGFQDDGQDIEYSLKTKRHDFGDPATWKDFEYIELIGYKNLGSEPVLDVVVDENYVYTATLDDTYVDDTAAAITVGVEPVATESTGGGGEEESTGDGIDIYPYRIRLGQEIFADGTWMELQLTCSSGILVMTLDQMEIKYENNTNDLVPAASFA